MIRPFKGGERVETFAYDPNHRRFIIGGHYGTFKVFKLEDEGLTMLWSHDFNGILSYTTFDLRGVLAKVYMLEIGQVCT